MTYPPTILDSDTALIILRRILASTCLEALMNVHCRANGFTKSDLLPRKWYPSTRLLPPETDRYKELEDAYINISDASYVIDGLG